MEHSLNPSMQEAEAVGFMWVRGKPGLQSEFQSKQSCYKKNPCLKKRKLYKKNFFFIFMWKGVFPACMPVYYVSKEAKRDCWIMRLELHIVVSHWTQLWTQILCKNSHFSNPIYWQLAKAKQPGPFCSVSCVLLTGYFSNLRKDLFFLKLRL